MSVYPNVYFATLDSHAYARNDKRSIPYPPNYVKRNIYMKNKNEQIKKRTNVRHQAGKLTKRQYDYNPAEIDSKD